MKLHERLPDRVKVGRRTYRIDADFRNVLAMLDELRRDDLLPGARAYRALRCVMRHPPRDANAALAAVRAVLFPDSSESGEGPKLTDFEQDADVIRAAFLQAYHINLWRDRLHWIEFRALLNALPDGSRYSEILSIRARPMPEATKFNAKEREWLIKAKAHYAVHMTERERETSYARGLHTMAMGLREMAKRGGKNA